MSEAICPVKECRKVFIADKPEQVLIDLHAHYRKYHDDDEELI